ncbi:sugar transferase [Cellulomonas composti]|uniref:Exopolysaccharide biosynthesis polyprenyl glycosylphosphotransferase n=1 Tax=Cellulomonas composti TaxID=266130 RepID=A0A511JAG1_9CELL|nr:sugar transferase [Cellulomonas composti]GEL94976.1 exopolysaccharide biosynthesis polyprenyl glycosylphosphotransferase [Cellulomonas composti]
MTLTADRGFFAFGDDLERRRPSREPRRSWASAEPFVQRSVPLAATAGGSAGAWRAVRGRYAATAATYDAMCAAVIAYIAVIGPFSSTMAAIVAPSASIVFVALVAACGGYRRTELGDGPGEFQAVARASGLAAVAVMVYAFTTGAQVPRAGVLVGVPALAMSAGLVRYVRRRRLHRARRDGTAMRSTLVVGDPASVTHVIGDLSREPHHGYRIDGVCLRSLDGRSAVSGVPVVGGLADVVQVAVDRAAEVVIVTGSCLGGEAMRRLSWALGRAGVDLVMAPDLLEVTGPRLSVRPTAGLSLLEVELDAPRRRLLAKSALDISLASVVGLLLLPFVLLLALAVRCTSPGPAFFRQPRVGVDGDTFMIWKLRTMYVDAEQRLATLARANQGAGVLFKMREDPRVTPIGRLLRKYSLDELPQLWNVVRGEMSLVGPRPPLESEVAEYEDAVHRRLRVKPGLTGLWQVSGRSDLDWESAVRLDLRYVDNWSVAMDVMILWKTFRAVATGSGAY